LYKKYCEKDPCKEVQQPFATTKQKVTKPKPTKKKPVFVM